jgi:hypothetical protein
MSAHDVLQVPMELDGQQLPDLPSDCPACSRPICATCRSTWHSGLVSKVVVTICCYYPSDACMLHDVCDQCRASKAPGHAEDIIRHAIDFGLNILLPVAQWTVEKS